MKNTLIFVTLLILLAFTQGHMMLKKSHLHLHSKAHHKHSKKGIMDLINKINPFHKSEEKRAQKEGDNEIRNSEQNADMTEGEKLLTQKEQVPEVPLSENPFMKSFDEVFPRGKHHKKIKQRNMDDFLGQLFKQVRKILKHKKHHKRQVKRTQFPIGSFVRISLPDKAKQGALRFQNGLRNEKMARLNQLMAEEMFGLDPIEAQKVSTQNRVNRFENLSSFRTRFGNVFEPIIGMSMRVIPIKIGVIGNNSTGNATDSDNQFFSFSKMIDESINNSNNGTKRIVLGKEETNNNGNKTSNVIHKADDMNGNDLSLEDEQSELQKNKDFFQNLNQTQTGLEIENPFENIIQDMIMPEMKKKESKSSKNKRKRIYLRR